MMMCSLLTVSYKKES